MRRVSIPLFLLAITLTAAVGCGAPQRKTMTTQSEGFVDENVLVVDLEASPSGSSEFNFCPSPPEGAKLNATNAAWLSFMAANEYSHLHYLSTALDELGFKTPGDAGFDWPQCAIDLRVLRGFEKRNADELERAFKEGKEAVLTYLKPKASADGENAWGACARRWWSESGYDGSSYPSPSFEKYLIQTRHEGHYVQFFSGGEFVLEGKAFVEGSTQVFFARHATKPVLIISFRGTEPNKWRDVAADGKAWKTKLKEHGWPEEWGSVHSGFRGAFDSLGELMREKLGEYEGSGVGIWVTGHSLGGALATMMGAEILRRIEGGAEFDLRGVYTFGSPRVGNNAFHDQFTALAAKNKTRVVRFRNGDDLVTAIPGLMLEYKHVGTLVHLGEDSLELPDKDPDYSGVGSAADHNIGGWGEDKKPVTGYYRRIKALLPSHPPGSEHNSCETP